MHGYPSRTKLSNIKPYGVLFIVQAYIDNIHTLMVRLNDFPSNVFFFKFRTYFSIAENKKSYKHEQIKLFTESKLLKGDFLFCFREF